MNKGANRWGKVGENFNLLVVDSEGKIRNKSLRLPSQVIEKRK